MFENSTEHRDVAETSLGGLGRAKGLGPIRIG
jgi:hypothetical protein